MHPYYSDSLVELYHGRAEVVLWDLYRAGRRANLVLTDPPYGVRYQNQYTRVKHKVLHGDEEDFSYLGWGLRCYRLLEEGSALFAYTGWSVYPDHYKQLTRAGFTMKAPLIVQKRQSGSTDLYGAFQTNSDWLLFGHKGRFKFRQTELLRNQRAGTIPNKGRKPVPEFKRRFPSCWFGPEYPWSTENPSTAGKYKHPTVKTVELMRWLILLCTDEGDTVLDPFCGSGTTLVAASLCGRKSVGVEVDEGHCQTVASRLRELRP